MRILLGFLVGMGCIGFNQSWAKPPVVAKEVIEKNDFSDLVGNWGSGCVPDLLAEMKFSFEKGILRTQVTQFLDLQCTKVTNTIVQVYKVSPGSRNKDTPSDAHPIDMTLVSHTQAPVVPDLASRLSLLYEKKMVPGVPTDVTGKGGIPRKGTQTYTIYRVKGNQLEVGDNDAFLKHLRPHAFSKVKITRR